MELSSFTDSEINESEKIEEDYKNMNTKPQGKKYFLQDKEMISNPILISILVLFMFEFCFDFYIKLINK